MADSLKFGTSGLRGLACDLEGAAAQRYTAAFLAHVRRKVAGYSRVFIARDLRASSSAIARDCAAAIRAAGLEPVDCGMLPTPALALHAMAEGGPAIMVTGSHIPADRNGLKFYTPQGEITKEDELGILGALADEAPAVNGGKAIDGSALAGDRYRQRYRHLLGPAALSGWRIGVFEHSSVVRDHLCSVLHRAGAAIVRLGRAGEFVAVDTEAFSDAIYAPRHGWIAGQQLDAIVSTDGDGDRPLIIDAEGNFLRGDVIGILTAQFVGADIVVTPVTSNSAIEAIGAFAAVERTKVGSPYVIAGMEEAAHAGGKVVGFEANGGVLLGTDVQVDGHRLTRLPTRDAILPILAVLASAARAGLPLAELAKTVALRPALSDRLTQVPTEKTAAFTARLGADPAYARAFFSGIGEVESQSSVDGPRFVLKSGDIIHYRPSGNAPELRCYVEGKSSDRAEILLRWGLDAAARAVR